MAHGPPDPQDDAERQLAAVAYLLTWLTGLLVLVLASRERRHARWHAIQAIGLGVLAAVVLVLLSLVQFLFFLAGVAFGATSSGGFELTFLIFPFLGGGLAGLGSVVVLVVAIVFAVKAYNGEAIRIPVIAELADDHA